MHVLPDLQEVAHAAREVVGVHRQRGGVDRAGRRAAQDRERVLLRVAEDVAHRLDHADLVGGARAASSQHQSGSRFHRAGFTRTGDCSWPRGALASATASAVMLTMRRTVAEGVRMCTGRAAPSRIGPMVTFVGRGDLEQVERDVGRVQGRHHQQVRLAAHARVRKHPLADIVGERGIAVHFALHLQVRRALIEDRERLLHLSRRGQVHRAEIRGRQQRHLGHDAEAPDLLGGEDRHFGDMRGVRIRRDVGIADEHRAVGQDQRVHRRVVPDAGPPPDHLVDVLQVQRVRAEGAAQHARRPRPCGSSSRRSA